MWAPGNNEICTNGYACERRRLQAKVRAVAERWQAFADADAVEDPDEADKMEAARTSGAAEAARECLRAIGGK